MCVCSCGGALYAYVRQQNDAMKIRIELPRLAREVRLLQEGNDRLRYEIETFENPKHLMELARRPEFGHLKYPIVHEVMTMQVKEDPREIPLETKQVRTIFVGSR